MPYRDNQTLTSFLLTLSRQNNIHACENKWGMYSNVNKLYGAMRMSVDKCCNRSSRLSRQIRPVVGSCDRSRGMRPSSSSHRMNAWLNRRKERQGWEGLYQVYWGFEHARQVGDLHCHGCLPSPAPESQGHPLSPIMIELVTTNPKDDGTNRKPACPSTTRRKTRD